MWYFQFYAFIYNSVANILCITLPPHLNGIDRNKVMKLEALPYVIFSSLGCMGEAAVFLKHVLETVSNLLKSCSSSTKNTLFPLYRFTVPDLFPHVLYHLCV